MAGRICALLPRSYDQLFDVAQTILAEKNLTADIKRGRSEGAALDRPIRVRDEFVLHWPRLDQLNDSRGRKPGGVESGAEDVRVVHLFGLGPHVAEHLVDIALEHANRFC